MQNPEVTNRLCGPPGPAGPVAPGAVAQIDTRWRIEEFGLFEPDLIVDTTHLPGDVVTISRDTIYCNVDAFVERIKDAIATKGPETVRDNLHICLRGHTSH
jgi:hypothetical protein